MWLIIQSIIMGIVEGVTEFLPISSTGHLILVGNLIKFEGEFAKLFEIVIQLGAILAIVVLFWDKLWGSFKGVFTGDKKSLIFWVNLFIAFLPLALIGLKYKNVIELKLFNPIAVSAALIFGGILMLVIENKFRKKYKTRTVDDIKFGQALIIGGFQCLALWPGMSRSASTIMGGWISGLSTVAAAEFSFFLAVPTMIVATVYSLIKVKFIMTNMQVIALAVGFVVSFIVALVVVEKFIGFLKKKPMRVFAFYRIIIGVIFLVLAFSNIITITT